MSRCWLISIAIFLCNLPAHAQDRCKEILANGVWEYRVGMSETQYVSSFLNWYGSTTSTHSGSTKKQSLTGSAVYEGAPVSLGLSNDQTKNDEFFSKLEKLNSGYEQYDSTVVTFIKKASDVIVKAWSDCISNSPVAGVRASLRFTGNPRDLIVELSYKPINNNVPVARVKLAPPQDVRCEAPDNAAGFGVATSGKSVRCTRKEGEPGAIVLSSDTVVYPDSTLSFPAALIRTNLSGRPYAVCDVFEDVRSGNDALDVPESLPNSSRDLGGGTPTASVGLEVPVGYELTNVQTHCQKLDCDNPCAFVRGLGNVVWTIPKRKAEMSVSTDSCRVSVWMSGTKQKVITGIDRRKHPSPLNLLYGRTFSVEFPSNALDVKLYCNAGGNQRIFSLSDIQKEGDQVYLRGVRQSSTGKIIDLAVAPYDLGP